MGREEAEEAATWSSRQEGGGAPAVSQFLGLGEGRVSLRFAEDGEVLKIYRVVYGTMPRFILDTISSILRGYDHLGSTVANTLYRVSFFS
jgi:hypothetical protein